MEIGTIRHGSEVGIKPYNAKFIWAACKYCGRERWVRCVGDKPVKDKCHKCWHSKVRKLMSLQYNDLEGNSHWRGGTRRDHGYVEIKLRPDDFFYPMAKKSGYVSEHRLVVAKRLGRCLQPWEIVHHKDHIRDHNTDDNLQLVSDDRHQQITAMENRLNEIKTENKKLKEENEQLKLEMIRRDNERSRSLFEQHGNGQATRERATGSKTAG